MVDSFALREAEKAYQRMMSGKARFRVRDLLTDEGERD